MRQSTGSSPPGANFSKGNCWAPSPALPWFACGPRSTSRSDQHKAPQNKSGISFAPQPSERAPVPLLFKSRPAASSSASPVGYISRLGDGPKLAWTHPAAPDLPIARTQTEDGESDKEESQILKGDLMPPLKSWRYPPELLSQEIEVKIALLPIDISLILRQKSRCCRLMKTRANRHCQW